jgi:hypothetical protein
VTIHPWHRRNIGIRRSTRRLMSAPYYSSTDQLTESLRQDLMAFAQIEAGDCIAMYKQNSETIDKMKRTSSNSNGNDIRVSTSNQSNNNIQRISVVKQRILA